MNVAIIVGGAESVWSEIDQARALCSSAGCEIEFYITNDMIAAFPESAIGVTLQVHKLDKWLAARAAKGFLSLTQMWAHKAHCSVTNVATEQNGSVGLVATQIAIANGHEKVLLCGVPMDKAANHFVRQRPWDACDVFKGHWRQKFPVLRPSVRSFSGWTATNLGSPDVVFLRGEQT